jgi:hypothetical protein
MLGTRQTGDHIGSDTTLLKVHLIAHFFQSASGITLFRYINICLYNLEVLIQGRRKVWPTNDRPI